MENGIDGIGKLNNHDVGNGNDDIGKLNIVTGIHFIFHIPKFVNVKIKKEMREMCS